MNKKDEALKMALEAVEWMNGDTRPTPSKPFKEIAQTIREALAEQPAQQQEPVAWVDVKDTHHGPYEFHGKELLPFGKHELYTSPPASKPWVGLTDGERHTAINEIDWNKTQTLHRIATAIEAKLREKNA